MKRPDGVIATAVGWALMVVGALAAFFMSAAETPNGFLLSSAIANLGFGLGVLLLSLGCFVQAIWHLPGRKVESEGAAIQQCTYCELVIREPSLPYSSVPTIELRDMIERIDDRRCLRTLRAKELIPE